MSDDYTRASALERRRNNSLLLLHAPRFERSFGKKAPRRQKCPPSLKIVDSVNKKVPAALTRRGKGGGGMGCRGRGEGGACRMLTGTENDPAIEHGTQMKASRSGRRRSNAAQLNSVQQLWLTEPERPGGRHGWGWGGGGGVVGG